MIAISGSMLIIAAIIIFAGAPESNEQQSLYVYEKACEKTVVVHEREWVTVQDRRDKSLIIMFDEYIFSYLPPDKLILRVSINQRGFHSRNTYEYSLKEGDVHRQVVMEFLVSEIHPDHIVLLVRLL